MIPRALLIFDIDGVLVDASNSYRQAIQQTCRFFTGLDVSPAEIQSYKNRGGLNNDWDLTEAILKDNGMQIEKKLIIKKFQEYYNRFKKAEKWLLNKTTLDELSKNYSLAILTGRPWGDAYESLKTNAVKWYFKLVVAMEDVSRQKPDPEGLLKILGKYPGMEAYYFGDTVDDMKAAVSAGVIPIGVLPPQDKSGSLEALLINNGARIVIQNINEIYKALK